MDWFVLSYASLNGIVVGAMLGGIALGLSLIFGVLRIVNFAHGSFLMLAMYTAFWLQQWGALDPYVSVLVAAPLMFGLGWAVQAWVIGPLIRRERALVVEPISALLLTAGVYILIDNLALMAFGPNVRSTNSTIAMTTLMVGDFPLNTFRVVAAVAALLMAGGVSLWLARTDTGRAIRATAQNRDAAAMSGIDVPRIYNMTFGLGCAMVGVMGCLIAPFIPVTPHVGLSFGIKSFIVVVLGGIGSIAGSLVGGIVIGLFESVASQFVATPTASIFSLGLFIVILLVRPQGLMGGKSGHR
jgi:branched-chain amino acid transport system permease protein